MNERIKELAKQAGVYFGKGSVDYFGEKYPAFISTDEMDVEKFAELIVKECTRIVTNNGIATAEHDQMVRQDCVNEIKQHFGVEE